MQKDKPLSDAAIWICTCYPPLGTLGMNPFRPNGFFHSIILDKSILPFRDVRLIISQLFDIKIGVYFKQTVKTMIR